LGAAGPNDAVDAPVSRLEIAEAALEPAGDALLAAGLDTPHSGLTSPFYGFDLRGWAIGRQAELEAVTVRSSAGSLPDAEVGGERADVAEFHPVPAWAATSEFFLPVGALRLEPEFELTVEARLRGGELARVATVRGRRAPLRTGFSPSVQPVALTTLGRTGSTAATRLLSSHPEVVAYRPFEFEPRVVSYWIDLLRDLADPRSFRRQVTPNGPLSEAWWVGRRAPLPRRIKDDDLQALLGGENVEAIAELCQGRIDRFYVRVAELFERPRSSYFVEKLGPSTGALVRELYPDAREIFLVRDFRDMVASTFAFNDKRGFQGFGRDRAPSDAEYVRGVVAESVGELLSAWRTRGEGAHLLRYEDLIQSPRETVAAAFEFLGLEAGGERIDATIATLDEPGSEVHRTSAAEQSIGRWRRDLAADVQEACDAALGGALREFGYG
jgi:Sulfotransferase family